MSTKTSKHACMTTLTPADTLSAFTDSKQPKFCCLHIHTKFSCELFPLHTCDLVFSVDSSIQKWCSHKIDILFFLGGISVFPLAYLGSFLWPYSNHVIHRVFKIFLILLSLIPVLYGIILFLHKVLPRKFQVALKRYCSIPITCRRRSVEQDMEDLGYLYRFETEDAPILKLYSV